MGTDQQPQPQPDPQPVSSAVTDVPLRIDNIVLGVKAQFSEERKDG